MDYIRQLLAQGEQIVLVTRRHWIALLPVILVDAGVIIVILALSIGLTLVSPPLPLFGLLLLLVPIAHLVSRLVVWWNARYIVTNRRVMEVRGVFQKHVSDSSREKVNDVVMEQSALGRMLDYGDVRIITGSDVGVNLFQRIAHPIRFKVAMLDQKSDLSRSARPEPGEVSPRDVPELLAKLDELRRQGVLTEEEFSRQKQQLLERLSSQ
jgi:uncharacterized membrane protein YdbT with pleckstrin-like domain